MECNGAKWNGGQQSLQKSVPEKLSNCKEMGSYYIAFYRLAHKNTHKHTQTEHGKSIRLWESISQALNGHTLDCNYSYSYQWFQDLISPFYSE